MHVTKKKLVLTCFCVLLALVRALARYHCARFALLCMRSSRLLLFLIFLSILPLVRVCHSFPFHSSRSCSILDLVRSRSCSCFTLLFTLVLALVISGSSGGLSLSFLFSFALPSSLFGSRLLSCVRCRFWLSFLVSRSRFSLFVSCRSLLSFLALVSRSRSRFLVLPFRFSISFLALASALCSRLLLFLPFSSCSRFCSFLLVFIHSWFSLALLGSCSRFSFSLSFLVLLVFVHCSRFLLLRDLVHSLLFLAFI